MHNEWSFVWGCTIISELCTERRAQHSIRHSTPVQHLIDGALVVAVNGPFHWSRYLQAKMPERCRHEVLDRDDGHRGCSDIDCTEEPVDRYLLVRPLVDKVFDKCSGSWSKAMYALATCVELIVDL